nr:unnamed protein product [Callosobruchus chinensis]
MTKKRVKIREFSKLIGNLVSICCATEYGWLYLKSLEREKYLALKRSSDNYNMKMKVNSSIKKELNYLNKKCECFVSWLPDPESIAVDAFTISWTGLKGYIFPPFSLLPKILSKIETEQAECLVVFPMWKSQPWYPKLESLIVSENLISCYHPSGNRTQCGEPLPWVQRSYPDVAKQKNSPREGHDGDHGNIETILQPGVNEVLSFLKQQFDRGPQYSTLNVHRSALNLICDAGKSELVDRFMKGVFKLRPNFPRYEEIWDPESVLKYIISLYPLNKLSLEDLTVMLNAQLSQLARHPKERYIKLAVDEMAKENDFTVLRLPPYHYELNPIELVWAQVKNEATRKNTTFKLADICIILEKAIGAIIADNWQKCVSHVKVEEEKFWNVDTVIEPVTVNLE